jgi:hypothetical protein
MTSDQHQPDPGEVEHAVQAEGGPEPEQAVEAALHQGEPSIDVADLHVEQADDAIPVVEGRVGSEKDRQWAIGLARNALGQEVHDALQVDESLPTTAPAEVISGFEGEGELDSTQGTTDLLNPTPDQGRSYDLAQESEQASGENPPDESRTAPEYMEPGVEHRRSRGPDDIRGPA